VPSPFACSTFCFNLQITHRNSLLSVIPIILLCFKTTSVLRLFGPCSSHDLFFVQELLNLAAARTYFLLSSFAGNLRSLNSLCAQTLKSFLQLLHLMRLLSGLVRHNTVAKWSIVHFLGLDTMGFDFVF
jgi:hypothetical protein